MSKHVSFIVGLLMLVLCVALASTASAQGRLWTVGEQVQQDRQESWLSRKTGGFLSDGTRSNKPQARLEMSTLGDPQLRVGNSLTAIDADTGRELWKRDEVEVLPIPGMPLVFEWDGRTLQCLDVYTGERRWQVSAGQSKGALAGFRSFIPVHDLGLVLLIGSGSGGREESEVAAANIATGEVLWKSSEILDGGITRKPVELMSSLQPAVVDAEGIVIFLNAAGPVKFDPRDGRILWRSTQRRKAVFGSGTEAGFLGSPNWYDNGTPPMFETRGVLIVSIGADLYGFDMKTGAKLWATSKVGGFMPGKRYDSTIRGQQIVDRGLLVWGWANGENGQESPWVDLLDPNTGKYLFKKPVPVHEKGIASKFFSQSTSNTSWVKYRFVTVGDSLFVAAGRTIERVDLGRGRSKKLVEFKEGTRILQVENLQGRLYVQSRDWMSLVDPKSGARVYERHFVAPERSAWDQSLDGLVAIGGAYARQQAFEAFYKATNQNDRFETSETDGQYRRRSDRELDARLAEIGRRAKASSANAGAFAYFFVGDGEAGSAARTIEKIRKADGETVSRTAIDTQALEIDFRVDAFRNRYYINDGESIFAHAMSD